jgi:hypothetical protein
MPCKDTTALMSVRVDHNDYLINYDYTKMTCAKEVGGGQSFHQYCEGKLISQILRMEFFQILKDLALEDEDTELQFLVYLEWSALRSALLQYLGEDEDVDTEQFEVASVQYDDQKVQINQIVRPLANKPKIQSCFQRSLKASD